MTYIVMAWRFLGKGGWMLPVLLLLIAWINSLLNTAEERGRTAQATAAAEAIQEAMVDSGRVWRTRDSTREHELVLLTRSYAGLRASAAATRRDAAAQRSLADSLLRQLADTSLAERIQQTLATERRSSEACTLALTSCDSLQERSRLALTDLRGQVASAQQALAQLRAAPPVVRTRTSRAGWAAAGAGWILLLASLLTR